MQRCIFAQADRRGIQPVRHGRGTTECGGSCQIRGTHGPSGVAHVPHFNILSRPSRCQYLARASPNPEGGKGGSENDVRNDVDESFGFFKLDEYVRPMEAPWGLKNAVFGMAGWGASFLLVGLAFLPIARSIAGEGGFAALSQQDKAVFALINQVVETAVGVGIVTTSAGTFYNKTPGVLRLDFTGPLRKPDGWAVWAGVGVLLAPEIVYLASYIVDSLGAVDLTAKGTADAVSQIISLDGVTFGSLFVTTAILAPLLEETVFRGFLLPSLAKYVGTFPAVVLSSVAFGLVHFAARDTPQLTALGMLLGFAYVRSGNLLAPMIIHGAWNGTFKYGTLDEFLGFALTRHLPRPVGRHCSHHFVPSHGGWIRRCRAPTLRVHMIAY